MARSRAIFGNQRYVGADRRNVLTRPKPMREKRQRRKMTIQERNDAREKRKREEDQRTAILETAQDEVWEIAQRVATEAGSRNDKYWYKRIMHTSKSKSMRKGSRWGAFLRLRNKQRKEEATKRREEGQGE